MTETPAVDIGQEAHYVTEKKTSTSNCLKSKARLDRASLPDPLNYLSNQGLLESNHGGYAMIKCPVHKGGQEKHPSMAVYMPKGNFKCFSCGAKGGDIIDLHKLVTGNNFLTSVQQLGGRLYV